MYSGSDSTESQGLAPWGLNPSAYQNMSNEQVDWAALAQQWIIMKEAGPPPLLPNESKTKQKKDQLNEGGEAPMDVETEKEENLTEWAPNQQNWSWNAQTQTWGWNNAWTAPTGVPPPVPLKPPLLPTPTNFSQFNAPPESSSDNANFPGYNSTPSNEFSPGYWTGGGSKQIKPHNRRFSKVNVPRPVQPAVTEAPQPTLDANKRKQLPAWIREGLEKMERDKLKQIEKEKEKQERDEYNEKLKQSEKETMEILKSTIKEQQRSKFESDGEASDEEDRKKPVVHEPVVLNPDEQMLNVRRTMTEILLKVTNREIETICKEEIQRFAKKQKASDQRVSAPSGANVSAKLGLGMYGGDSGTSSSEDSDEEGVQNQKDSDTELKDSIKRKKAEFLKTEREIEDKLAEAESRKRQTLSRSPTPDTKDNDTQVDAKTQGPRKNRSSSRSQPPTKRPKSRSSTSSSDRDSRKRSSTSSSKSRESSMKTSKNEKKQTKSAKKRRSRSRTRSRSKSRERKRYTRRTRSRSRSSSYRRRRRSRSRSRRRSRSPYAKSRRSRSRSRRRRSRSSSSGRGKRSRRR